MSMNLTVSSMPSQHKVKFSGGINKAGSTVLKKTAVLADSFTASSKTSENIIKKAKKLLTQPLSALKNAKVYKNYKNALDSNVAHQHLVAKANLVKAQENLKKSQSSSASGLFKEYTTARENFFDNALKLSKNSEPVKKAIKSYKENDNVRENLYKTYYGSSHDEFVEKFLEIGKNKPKQEGPIARVAREIHMRLTKTPDERKQINKRIASSVENANFTDSLRVNVAKDAFNSSFMGYTTSFAKYHNFAKGEWAQLDGVKTALQKSTDEKTATKAFQPFLDTFGKYHKDAVDHHNALSQANKAAKIYGQKLEQRAAIGEEASQLMKAKNKPAIKAS